MKGGKSKAPKAKKPDSKLAAKKRGGTRGGSKSSKLAKDPNKPKRPPSAFFVFMEEFRKQYRQEFPNNKSVSAVGKAGGEKWKSMTAAEKAPYISKAEKRKAEYDNSIAAYKKKKSEHANDVEEESDKSKSEVHDAGDADSGEDDEDDE